MKNKTSKSTQEINPDCPCDELNCPRHGKCSECQDYHKKHPEDGKTACGK
jgi:hypothetical protein